jgi:hypothetical protein
VSADFGQSAPTPSQEDMRANLGRGLERQAAAQPHAVSVRPGYQSSVTLARIIILMPAAISPAPRRRETVSARARNQAETQPG